MGVLRKDAFDICSVPPTDLTPSVHRSDVSSEKLFWIAGTPYRLIADATLASRIGRPSPPGAPARGRDARSFRSRRDPDTRYRSRSRSFWEAGDARPDGTGEKRADIPIFEGASGPDPPAGGPGRYSVATSACAAQAQAALPLQLDAVGIVRAGKTAQAERGKGARHARLCASAGARLPPPGPGPPWSPTPGVPRLDKGQAGGVLLPG